MKYHLDPHDYQQRSLTKRIVIHCSDTPNDRVVTAADVRRWHTEERGWIDAGYHFFIRRDGSLEVLRPVWAVGAHAAGFNSDSIGICLAGRNQYSAAQWRTLKSLVGTLREVFPDIRYINGHRQLNPSKLCPGFDVPTWVAEFHL